MYIRVVILGALSRQSSIYRIFYKNVLFVILSVAEESSVAKMKINKKMR